MPSRPRVKHRIEPPSKFSFVPLGLEVEGVSWLKTHTRAARSHAAYWGGPYRFQQEDKAEIAGQIYEVTSSVTIETGSSSFDDASSKSDHVAPLPARRRRSGRSKSAKAMTVPPRMALGSLHQFEVNNLPSNVKVVDPFAADLSLFKFFGEDFVKQFALADHLDQSVLLDGCLLLSYANAMALTGHGTKTALLELKSRVFRYINEAMEVSDGSLSPQCISAVLALGSPIVCLVSQDLPKRMTISEYINATMQDDALCCREFANTAECALEERKVYLTAMYRLLSKSITSGHDPHGVALLRYIFNYINIVNAAEADDHLAFPLEDLGYLLPSVNSFRDCYFPVHWISPLTSQWLDGTSRTDPEGRMLLLTSLMHRWLATFVDGDGHILMTTESLLAERAGHRHRIEQFDRMSRITSSEAEAMYESCRWASFILLSVEELSSPINLVPKYVPDQPRLLAHLRKTDLPNLWGCRKGLLFWVVAVCHFSSAGNCLPLLTTTLYGRLTHELAMSHCCFDIAIKPLRRLKQFEILCCRRVPLNHSLVIRSQFPSHDVT